MKYALLIILLFPYKLAALDIWTYEYAVYKDSYPITIDEVSYSTSDLTTKGKTGARHPYENTRVLDANNTDYLHLIVTPTNQTERDYYQVFEDSGSIKLMRKKQIGTPSPAYTKPDNFDTKWEVAITTP